MPQAQAPVVPMSSAQSYVARRRPDAETRDLQRMLAAAAAGEEEAWNTIVERFGGCIRAVARAHRLSAHDTEDVVQATWLRLLEHIPAIREPERLGAWLQTTARRESLKLLRSVGREQPAEAEVFERQETFDDPDRRLAETERVVALDRAVQTLPVRHRQLIRMLLAEPEPSYAEISRALDMPIGSIGPIRARSLARLRRNPALRSAA